MSDEKKTDRVISLAEFNKDAQKESKITTEEMLEHVKEQNFKKICIIGEDENGRLGFFSTCDSYLEILFCVEAYKKLVMDYTVGFDG